MQKLEQQYLPKGVRLLNDNILSSLLRSPLEYVIVNKDGKQVDSSQLSLDGLAAEDFKPKKDEDYLQAKFRALSARYLGESGFFLDFSKEGVLKASVGLMLPETLGGRRRKYLKFVRDHSLSVDDIIGFISGAQWSESDSGLSAPGINVDVSIDMLLAPRQARQLLSEPPLVESVSVLVAYSVERSHPDMSGWEFYAMLGREIDGQIVRFIVTEILDYRHLGLVDEGADEEADHLQANNDSTLDVQEMSTKNTEKIMDTLELQVVELQELLAPLGVKKIETADDLISATKKLAGDLAKTKSDKEALSEKAEKYDEVLAARRQEVKDMATKLDGDDAQPMHSAIDKMEWQELSAMAKSYSDKIAVKFKRSSQEETVDEEQQTMSASNGVDTSQYKIA